MRWWLKFIGGLLTVAVLLWLVVRIGDVTLDILSSYRGEDGQRDPQFAEEAETVTRPPELWEEAGESEFKDNSEKWEMYEKTPVEQTAEELAEEARAARNDS